MAKEEVNLQLVPSIRAAFTPADIWHHNLPTLYEAAKNHDLHRQPQFRGWVVSKHLLVHGRNNAPLPPHLADVAPITPLGVPFLLSEMNRQAGVAGFVSMAEDALKGPRNLGSQSPFFATCQSVIQWLQRFQHDELHLTPTIQTPGNAHGRSIGLAALWAAVLNPFPKLLKKVFHGETPTAATGCWQADNGSGMLSPAGGDTLNLKLHTAKQIGYCRIFLIDGQEVDPDFEKDLEFVYFSARPEQAVRQIFMHLGEYGDISSMEIQDFLLQYEAHVVRDRDYALQNRGAIEGFLNPFCRSQDKWVKVLSAIMLNVLMLNAGQTKEAKKYAELFEAQLSVLRQQKPIPPYVKGVLTSLLSGACLPARMAIQAIDTGNWDADATTWRMVDEAISYLDSRIDSRKLPAYILPRQEDAFALMINKNVRARRKEYVARLTGDYRLLRLAHEDRMSLVKYWPGIVAYATENSVFSGDNNIERQHNQVLETPFAHWELTGEWPNDWEYPEWYFLLNSPEPPHENYGTNVFNYLAYARYQLAVGKTRKIYQELKAFIKKLGAQERLEINYPLNRLLDLVMMYHRDEETRVSSALCMQKSIFANPRNHDEHDITYLLALRSSALINHVLGNQPLFNIRKEIKLRQCGSLKSIAEKALADPVDVKTFAVRMPY